MAANTKTNRKIVKQPEMAKHPVFSFSRSVHPCFAPLLKGKYSLFIMPYPAQDTK